MWEKYNSDSPAKARRQRSAIAPKENITLMKNKTKILIGSSNAANVARIHSKLDSNADLTVVENWEEFCLEASKNIHFIRITDLNMIDCFPSVIIDNIQEHITNTPIVILLEDRYSYNHYRDILHHTIEILPFDVIEDERFLCVLEAVKLKYDFLKDFI